MAGMTKPKPVSTMLIAAVLIAVVVPRCEARRLKCEDVAGYMNVCEPYVSDAGPLGECCVGVRSLLRESGSTPARLTICGCLKFEWYTRNKKNDVKMAGLPGQCGVNAPFIGVTDKTDCAQFKKL